MAQMTRICRRDWHDGLATTALLDAIDNDNRRQASPLALRPSPLASRPSPLTPLLLLALLVLAGCAQPPAPTPTRAAATPLPPLAMNGTGVVRAAGKVQPAQHANLSFAAAGRVTGIPAHVGDQVAAGDPLVQLDRTAAAAAVTEAQGALFRAQANLANLQAGAQPAAIAAAQAGVDTARAQLAQLSETPRPAALQAAQAEVAAAQAALQQLSSGPRENERIAAKAALSNAEAALNQARSAYNQVAMQNNIGMLPESRALQEATNNYEAAKARYDALYAGPDADAAAAARARLADAQAALDKLQTPATAGKLAEAEAKVRSAQAALDLLTAEPRSSAVAAAAVAVTEAEAALNQAQAALDDLTLRAPFSGTVTALNANLGELVQPGQVAATVADLGHLQVETTDLSERDVSRVAVGQPVAVSVKPLGARLNGRVTQIAPQATVVGGDVVYTVTIALDNPPPGLRWGMSVDVEITASS